MSLLNYVLLVFYTDAEIKENIPVALELLQNNLIKGTNLAIMVHRGRITKGAFLTYSLFSAYLCGCPMILVMTGCDDEEPDEYLRNNKSYIEEELKMKFVEILPCTFQTSKKSKIDEHLEPARTDSINRVKDSILRYQQDFRTDVRKNELPELHKGQQVSNDKNPLYGIWTWIYSHCIKENTTPTEATGIAPHPESLSILDWPGDIISLTNKYF